MESLVKDAKKEAKKEAKGAEILTNQLTAEFDSAGKIIILGDKTRKKVPNKATEKFKFRLDDNTGKNVCFASFGAQLGTTCPSAAGDNTGQISELEIEDKRAEFTDDNTGPPCTFAYAWFFSCDDPTQQPVFDPIVDNGGNL